MPASVNLYTTEHISLGSIVIFDTDSVLDVLEKISEACDRNGYELQTALVRGQRLVPSNQNIRDSLPAGMTLKDVSTIMIRAGIAGTGAAALPPAAERRLKMQKAFDESRRREDDRRELVSMAAYNIQNDDIYEHWPMELADVRFTAVSLDLEPLFPGEKKTISLKVGPTSGYDLYTAFSDALHGIGKVCFLSMTDLRTKVPVLDDKDVLYNVYDFSRFFVNVQKLPSGSARGGGRRQTRTRKVASSKPPRISISRSLKQKRSQKKSRARKQ